METQKNRLSIEPSHGDGSFECPRLELVNCNREKISESFLWITRLC